VRNGKNRETHTSKGKLTRRKEGGDQKMIQGKWRTPSGDRKGRERGLSQIGKETTPQKKPWIRRKNQSG